MKYLRSWSKITYALVLRINLGGNFVIRKNHFTSGNLDWFGENNIPRYARDVIFPKPVSVPLGKVIFPDKKITSLVNPQNECVNRYYIKIVNLTPLVAPQYFFCFPCYKKYQNGHR